MHAMADTLTFAEIASRFTSEWVLLGDPEVGPGLEVNAGQVLCHSKDRDEVYRAARTLRPKQAAIVYTGKLPDDAVVVLCAYRSIPPRA